MKFDAYSIFDRYQVTVAHHMVKEGLAKMIGPENIPPSALFNEAGARASCALILTPEMKLQFDERVAALAEYHRRNPEKKS
jgi:hypothetical protein